MYIEVNKYDKRYPYTISDAWGGKVCMTEEGLKKLQEEIKKVLDKPVNLCYNEGTKKKGTD